MVPLVPPGADIGNQRTADVVPNAENGAGQGSFWAFEVVDAEARPKSAVLHADFDHHRATLGAVHADEPGNTEAHRVAEQIMQDDDAENDEPACGDLAFVQSDDNGDDQDDAADGDERQGVAQELQVTVKETVHHHAGDDGQQYGFQITKIGRASCRERV